MSELPDLGNTASRERAIATLLDIIESDESTTEERLEAAALLLMADAERAASERMAQADGLVGRLEEIVDEDDG